MSLLDRNPNTGTAFPTPLPAQTDVPDPAGEKDMPAAAGKQDVPAPARNQPVPRTRTGAVWVGICAAAVAAVALIVFMLQNTASTEVSFLGLHGTLPLALALLIATVGGILLTLIVGTARIAQLRRLAHRRGD